ncbi:MAG TPA: phosphotransferase [Agromyces sp.]
MSPARPSEVARFLGLHPAAIRTIQEHRNAHWVIREENGTYAVLRRFDAGVSGASVDYEMALVAHLAGSGWPVAAPLAAPIEVGGRWWAAFPRLGGRRHEWGADEARHRWRGELLAKLHHDTRAFAIHHQRDGAHRTDEASEITPEHVALLARLRRIDRLRAVAFERHARQIAEGVAFLRAGRFPVGVIHGDFLPWNLHVRGKALLAVFDFEWSRRDTHAADVAWATWGGRYPSTLEGYVGAASFSEEEEAALPLLWRAGLLAWGWAILARTRDRVEPELDAVLEKLARPWGE